MKAEKYAVIGKKYIMKEHTHFPKALIAIMHT